MIDLSTYITEVPNMLKSLMDAHPWETVKNLNGFLQDQIESLNDDYTIDGAVAIHKKAIVEHGAVLKGPIIISKGCFVAAHSYLRGGVFLGNNVTIGPSCEIKSSIILNHSAIAHFNFIGDSIIGANVNFEAGSLIANHFNEREIKKIHVYYKGNVIDTKANKFGALVGDDSKIGANAVLSPGTLLTKKTVVKRLELIHQVP